MRGRSAVVSVLVLVLALGVLAPAQGAKKKKKPPAPQKIERVVEFPYTCPCTGSLQIGTLGTPLGNFGGGAFAIGAGEIYLTGEATDTSGMPIPVGISQDDGTGFNAPVGDFCGATEAPILLNEGMEVRVFVGSLSVCPGVALGGDITFTLSNMP
ncbi:MAG TPA: hypothetical protein VNC78_06900 [Actinomycetota bacterium]|nr:hypothetical protein [Actinomycetota bacterium]